MYQIDSRKINKGDTYLVLPNGEKYIEEAFKRGAQNYLKLNRKELGELGQKVFQDPSQKLAVIGVTGTNGKTTVTHLVNQVLNNLEPGSSFVLGTITANLTTPESWDILTLMQKHFNKGGKYFVMEVSSHGIAQDRIYGINFAIKALTNITQDHLDFHKTFANYKKTKMKFMNEGDSIKIYPEDYQKVQIDFKHQLLGDFNLANLELSYLILQKLGLTKEQIEIGLSKAKAPKGRFEQVITNRDFLVVVDYAHTPDGMKKVLETAGKIVKNNGGRVLTLFGCGGDRDRTKRPLMAEVAVQLSDFVIITNDNPRTEDQNQIVQDILQGLPKDFSNYQVILDRKEAIIKIIKMAKKNDIVMLLGKGHENYQIFADKTIHFDDGEVVREVLNCD